jgi:hypothetical protein
MGYEAGLRKIPGVGIGAKKPVTFFDRQNPRRRAAVTAALDRLGESVGILFSPKEPQSRWQAAGIQKGAFRLAIEQQLPSCR